MSTILLVEDDESLGNNLKVALERASYICFLANSVSSAKVLLSNTKFDLIILDVGLPDGSGFEILESITKQESTLPPVLFLSAMNSAEFRLKGFELGCFDYIPKPFHLRELLLRISKALPSVVKLEEMLVNGIKINLISQSITYPDGRTEYPATRDFKILKQLIESAPKIVSRQEILNNISENSPDLTPRTIDNSIVRLRQILNNAETDCIRAVRGLGYQWIG